MCYHDDHRVRAGERQSLFDSVDADRMVGIILLEDDDGDEEEASVRVKYVVCETCEGRGKHVNPSIDGNGLTSEDFAEDPEFREEYMSGRYDVTCYECKGERVVLDLDRDNVEASLLARIDSMLEEREDDERERAAERRMGA
jgi:hypothetical protein